MFFRPASNIQVPFLQPQFRRGRASGVFDPGSYGTASFWIVGDDAPSGAVGTWPFRTYGYNATQAASAAQPSRIDSALNGHHVVRFDGFDDSLATITLAGSALFSAASGTFFIVQKQFFGIGQNTTFSWESGGTTNRVLTHLTYDNVMYFDFGDIFGGGRISNAQPSGWDDSWHVVALTRDTTGSIHVNGQSVLSAAMLGSINTALSSPLWIGSYGGSGIFFGGEIAEIIFFKDTLSTGNRQAIEDYLGAKYGIAITH